ncbi:MAG: spermine synthase [Chthoniobacterales bacterium]
MKPFRNLAETRTPNGARFSLHEHDGDYFLKLDGKQLMSTTSTVSELLLADVACTFRDKRHGPKVLIGGLGLGFSLKRVLELVDTDAVVQVAELLPEVVAWNREFLGDVNGHLLNDSRVQVYTGDVFQCIRDAGLGYYDAILLDVDNGPTSFVQPQNSKIYKRKGLSIIKNSLTSGGRVAFWSAEKEPAFLSSLASVGFDAQEVAVKAHERAKRYAHQIYIGERH